MSSQLLQVSLAPRLFSWLSPCSHSHSSCSRGSPQSPSFPSGSWVHSPIVDLVLLNLFALALVPLLQVLFGFLPPFLFSHLRGSICEPNRRMSTTAFRWRTATLEAPSLPSHPCQQPKNPPSAKWACTDSKAASLCPTHHVPEAMPAGIGSPQNALTQLLQPFFLFLSPLPDALRLLSQPVSLGNCCIAISRPISLLKHKHSVPNPSCLPCCLCCSYCNQNSP